MKQLDNYEQWQAEKYGDILHEPIVTPFGEIWGTEAEIERQAAWCELQAELINYEHEK